MRLSRHFQHPFPILEKENLQQGREVIDEEREYSEHVEALWASSHSQVQSYRDLSGERSGRNKHLRGTPFPSVVQNLREKRANCTYSTWKSWLSPDKEKVSSISRSLPSRLRHWRPLPRSPATTSTMLYSVKMRDSISK